MTSQVGLSSMELISNNFLISSTVEKDVYLVIEINFC
jgi:hypothetical protein